MNLIKYIIKHNKIHKLYSYAIVSQINIIIKNIYIMSVRVLALKKLDISFYFSAKYYQMKMKNKYKMFFFYFLLFYY